MPLVLRWLLLGALTLCAGLVAGVVGATVARAEITAVWSTDQDVPLRVDVLNRTTFRVGGPLPAPSANGSPAYALMREGELFLVYRDDGRLWSRRWAEAEVPLDRVAVLAPNEAPPVEVDLKRTGLTETVAGHRGTVWELRWRMADGSMSLREVVASDMPALIEATAALARLSEAAESDIALQDGPAIGRLVRLLDEQNLGLLRLGASLRLEELRYDPLPPDALAVPPDAAQNAAIAEPEGDGGWLDRIEGDLRDGARAVRDLLDGLLGDGDRQQAVPD